jgi:hypothetical protein
MTQLWAVAVLAAVTVSGYRCFKHVAVQVGVNVIRHVFAGFAFEFLI